MLTALTAPQLEQSFACRYDDATRVIRATLTATGTPGDTVYTTLRNRHTTRPVHTIAHTLTAPTQQLTHTTDLETDANDTDGIYRGITGDYAIVAQDSLPDTDTTPTIRAVSPTLTIAIATPQQLTRDHLHGTPLRDESRLVATSTLDGTTIADMDARDIEPGLYAIYHDQTAHTLCWHHAPSSLRGPTVAYDPSGPTPTTLTLWNATRDQTMDLTLQPAIVAAQATDTYAVSIRYAPWTEAQTARAIVDATREVQAIIGPTGIEPRQHVSALLAASFPYADDRAFGARPYVGDDARANTVPLTDVGVRRILRVHRVSAHYGKHELVTLPGEWVATGETLSSLAYIFPLGGQLSVKQPAPTPHLYGFGIGYSGISAATVPGYWHLAVSAGLTSLWGDVGTLVREYVTRVAARRVLVASGRGALGPFNQESFSRDGVSLSRASGNGYAAEIEYHSQWLKEHKRMLIMRVTGMRGSR